MKAIVSAWRTGHLRLCIQCISVYALLLICFRTFVHCLSSEGGYCTWSASEFRTGAPIDGKLFRATSAETFLSSWIQSSVSCVHREYCIIENACVQPPKRKQRVIKFAIKGNASAFRPLSFRIKNEETKIEMVEMQEQDKHPIQFVPGTTVFYWLRHGNLLLNMMVALGLRETALKHSRPGEPTRFMALIPPRRAFRLDSSSVGDLYRAMFQSAGGSDTGVLDVASAVPGGQYVCFDRVVLGWESLSEPITGPQNSHLADVVTEKERRSDGEWLGKHRALYHALPAFTDAILRAVGAKDVPMEPKRAIVVVRETARSNVGKPQYRRILNMPDVVRAIEAAGYAVTMVDFAGMSLREQPADSDFWRDRDQVVDVDDFRRVLTVVQHTLTA